ncbi:MAG: Protein lysine acetyltransferase Pka [Phycisphaerae bacterium]|nr:Protein lysine acetyltransferase Pka [Phycisphaerae bacterium]
MTPTQTIPSPPEVVGRDLEPMFCPRSIAVLGASRREGSVGHAVLRNLIYGGYTGVIYAVNPKAKSILGLRCTPSLSAIDDEVDLAVVVTPPETIEGIVQEGADLGIRHFLIISAGFKEIGGEGAERELRIRQLARDRGLSIVGPNCLGLINTAVDVQMNATFATHMPRRGPLGLISQSGALCTALLDYAKGRGIGFSRFVSFGNKVDVTEIDLLRTLARDPNTKVILMYIEDLSAGQEFIEACNQIAQGDKPKPILVIKTGRTTEGAAAAASHTGSLAGSDEVYEAIFKQARVIRVESVGELFDCAEAFIDPLLPAGRKTAIVTNAGGPGIMATDACIRHGLTIPRFQDYTLKSLRFQMPPTSSIKNPVDVIGDAKHDRYRAALDAVTADENVDQVVVIVTPQMMTDEEEIAQVIAEIKGYSSKPIIGVLMGLVDVQPAVAVLQKHGVPTFIFPENAMRALSAKARYAEWQRRPISAYRQFEVQREAVAQLFDRELAAGRTQLVELAALEVLQHYGMATVPFALARSADEAAAAANQMGYPVVLKISGPKILHKTDVGGVRLNLITETEVRDAYDGMITQVHQHLGQEVEIWGVLVQKMLAKGKEIILGMTRDPKFGPLLMFGLGGIYTEALRDVAFRLAPIRENSARQMIRDIRSVKLLEGVRGEPPSDMEAVAEYLLRLSQLATDHPRMAELDINPLIVYGRGHGAIAADARVILKQS